MKAFPAASALALSYLFLTGCATHPPPAAENSGDNPDAAFWKLHLLYLLDTPYRRLYVEVDAVQGCEPTDAALVKLHDFLALHCRKPDGIEIARSPVIPRKDALGLPAETLACRFMKGPPTNSPASQPAFLEILFYDSALLAETGIPETGHPGANPSQKPHAWLRNPETEALPYPSVILMNTRYFIKKAGDDMLLHEAGHAIGLVSRTNYAADHHCLDPHCLMFKNLNAVLHLHLLLLGDRAITFEHRELCPRCLAELADDAKLPPPANLRFVGPVLVRSEAGYHVLSLPNRCHVIVGDLTDQDCRDFAAAVRAEPPNPDDHYTIFVKEAVLEDVVKRNEVLHRVGADPFEPVRHLVAEVCLAHGLLTNGLDICRQSIRLDPKDAWSYNQLAWIKATNPDASLRNGQEAVADATKACELTEWENGDWIDTLAATCAETGDFRHAIQYEKEALHTAAPAPSAQKAMRARLALYKHSKPYRESR